MGCVNRVYISECVGRVCVERVYVDRVCYVTRVDRLPVPVDGGYWRV